MFRKTAPAALPTIDTDSPSPTSVPSRREALLDMLRAPGGASIEDLVDRFGWKPHSARAMLTGLRKAGHDVQRDKAGSVTVYRVPA
jgi:hypothetical protein